VRFTEIDVFGVYVAPMEIRRLPIFAAISAPGANAKCGSVRACGSVGLRKGALYPAEPDDRPVHERGRQNGHRQVGRAW
jgi:hypothetical protein